MIEVKHLTKSYDSHPALDDLSFTIEKGRVYGFLGPNGAGKSTTMNIMTGYIGADSGEVLINGFDILKEPEKAKRSVGYLPEIPPLYPDMTVREYLSFVSELKEIPRKDSAAQVDKVLSLVRLTDVSSRLIRNLSKGYRQRTGLAAAVLGFPDIIILDEPTVGQNRSSKSGSSSARSPKTILSSSALISWRRSRRSAIMFLLFQKGAWQPRVHQNSWKKCPAERILWSLPSCRTRHGYSLSWILSLAYARSAGKETREIPATSLWNSPATARRSAGRFPSLLQEKKSRSPGFIFPGRLLRTFSWN